MIRMKLVTMLLMLTSLSYQQLVAVKKARDGCCTTFSGDQGECVKEKECEDVLRGRFVVFFQ